LIKTPIGGVAEWRSGGTVAAEFIVCPFSQCFYIEVTENLAVGGKPFMQG